jgi:copper chaperone CopZ
MKTSVIEVHDMLSVFSVEEVEKRIGEVPGVESVTVNFAAGNATVRFDETRLENADIKVAVRQRGYEATAPAAAAGETSEGQAMPSAVSAPAPPATAPAAATSATADTTLPDTLQQDKASPPTPPEPSAETPAAPADDEQKDKTTPDKS